MHLTIKIQVHRKEQQIMLSYDHCEFPMLDKMVRSLPNRKWSNTNKCWYIPAKNDNQSILDENLKKLGLRLKIKDANNQCIYEDDKKDINNILPKITNFKEVLQKIEKKGSQLLFVLHYYLNFSFEKISNLTLQDTKILLKEISKEDLEFVKHLIIEHYNTNKPKIYLFEKEAEKISGTELKKIHDKILEVYKIAGELAHKTDTDKQPADSCTDDINFYSQNIAERSLENNTVLKETVIKSGISKHFELHTLRHSFAMHLSETGTDIICYAKASNTKLLKNVSCLDVISDSLSHASRTCMPP